jgi:hypothetical protein
MICTSCNGSGKNTMGWTEIDGNTVTRGTFEVECFDCCGTGNVTPERVAQLQAMRDAWCSCGNPSGESDFHDDVFRNGVRVIKHHYTCCDCGLITQVG